MSDIVYQVRELIGKLRNEKFERFVNDILRLEYAGQGVLETMLNKEGNQRKSQPDAHIKMKTKSGDRCYIVFNHTIEGKTKVIKDIHNTIDSSLPNEQIHTYVTCTNQPISDYRAECEELVRSYGWNYEVYSIDGLMHLCLNKYKTLLNTYFDITLEEVENIKFYDCGHRIKVLRVERELNRAQLVDLLENIKSEKELENIENNLIECSSKLIDEIANLTGASITWLKFGLEKKYSPLNIDDYLNKDIYELSRLEILPSQILFCLEPEGMNILFLMRFSQYKIGYADYSYNLEFWNWIDEKGKITTVFSEFKMIFNKFHLCDSRIINNEDRRFILDGICFPKLIVDYDYNGKDGLHFIEDLMWYESDLKENFERNSWYKKYDWFVKLKEYFYNYYIKIKQLPTTSL